MNKNQQLNKLTPEEEKMCDDLYKELHYDEYGYKRLCCGGDYCEGGHNEFLKSFIAQIAHNREIKAYEKGKEDQIVLQGGIKYYTLGRIVIQGVDFVPESKVSEAKLKILNEVREEVKRRADSMRNHSPILNNIADALDDLLPFLDEKIGEKNN